MNCNNNASNANRYFAGRAQTLSHAVMDGINQ